MAGEQYSEAHEADPRQLAAEQLYRDGAAALSAAADIVRPGTSFEDIPTYFSRPAEIRKDAPEPDWSTDSEKVAGVRAELAKVGVGKEEDTLRSESAVTGEFCAVFEAGRCNKVIAELQTFLNDSNAQRSTHTLMLVGDPSRTLVPSEAKDEQERKSIEEELSVFRRLFGSLGEAIPEDKLPKNEYEMVEVIARQMSGFKQANRLRKGRDVVPVAYVGESTVEAVDEQHQKVTGTSYTIDRVDRDSRNATGQFRHLGWRRPADTNVLQEVFLMRIDRQHPIPGSNEYVRPGPSEVLALVSDALALSFAFGHDKESNIAFYTSSTYRVSRSADAARATLTDPYGRTVVLAEYGARHLAVVNGTEPKPVGVAQLPGEIHKAQKELVKLRKALDKPGEKRTPGRIAA